MLNFALHTVHLCACCQREIVSNQICPSCEEKWEREAKEYSADYSTEYFFGNLKVMESIEDKYIGSRN